MPSLANRIKDLRTALGFTQSELAQVLGVDKSTPSRWEQGVHDPSKGTILFLEILLKSKELGDCFTAIRDEAAA